MPSVQSKRTPARRLVTLCTTQERVMVILARGSGARRQWQEMSEVAGHLSHFQEQHGPCAIVIASPGQVLPGDMLPLSSVGGLCPWRDCLLFLLLVPLALYVILARALLFLPGTTHRLTPCRSLLRHQVTRPGRGRRPLRLLQHAPPIAACPAVILLS